ncbi:MAG: RNA polymerase sigma factor, partial [Limisphaerales bacterium]
GEAEAEWLEYMTSDETTEVPGDELGAREIVTKLLQLLPADDRLVISLLDLEQKSVAEIGEITGWGDSKVKVKAFRARKKLKAHAEELRETGRL